MLFSSFSFCHGVKCKYGECKTDYLSIPLECLIKICCVHAAPSCPELILLFRVIVMCLPFSFVKFVIINVVGVMFRCIQIIMYCRSVSQGFKVC